MTKLETPLIDWYWSRKGGTLALEFPATRQTSTSARRRIDAVILPRWPKQRVNPSEILLEGEEVIAVQAKASRLGMNVMGQAVFSLELLRRFKPASLRSVILCTADDSDLRPLLEPYAEVEVVVVPTDAQAP